MNSPRVYLAGPITGLTYDDCTDWRKHAAKQLTAHGIECFSPMRAKEYLSTAGKLRGAYEKHPTGTAKGITARDRFDVQRCDVVLMNLLAADRVSTGTMIEAGWADAHRKPIILAMEPHRRGFFSRQNIHEHPMLSELVAFRCKTLDAAIETVRAILLPS